ncbi:sarcosine oxidase subunit alpha [Rhizobium leguminosarum bv. trifolii]|uniref:glycine cleavage T C-terminal barrel domain-containing protein n=1 Tax=Rhizobium leguminosarum TaxID=384 RepID=UPI000E2F21C3|nr:glycine cleavage T C-terminal barrel domain-containing protein [Rhizobium leguminosarum]RFB86585.1 sarcosine oxidase subunit alpha [Rhizobium leguminosarum bv. trifolii]
MPVPAAARHGSHILEKAADPALENNQGYVISSYSAHTRSTIGLALVRRGSERHGEEVQIWNGLRGEFMRGRVCNRNFFDPDNTKLNVEYG